MKTKIICIVAVLLMLLQCVSVAHAYTYVEYTEKAEGLAEHGVTAYSDGTVFTSETSESIEINDPLANYELAYLKKSGNDGSTYYALKHNIYNIVERFNNGYTEFTISLSEEGGSMYLLQNGAAIEQKTIDEISADGWELDVLGEGIAVSIETDENDGKFAKIERLVISEDELAKLESINATYDKSLCRIVVSAYIPNSANELVSVTLINKDNNADIGYMDVATINSYNRLSYEFKFLGDISEYKLIINHGDKAREIDITEIDTGAVPEASLSVSHNDGSGRLSLYITGNEAFFGVNEACRLIIAYYTEDNSLIKLDISDSWARSMTKNIPAQTSIIKCYAWNSITKLVPLCSPYEISIAEQQN